LFAFPGGAGVNGLRTASEPEPHALSAMSHLLTPVARSGPGVAPFVLLEFILHSSIELLPGIEGPGIPDPSAASGDPGTLGAGIDGEPRRPVTLCGRQVNCATGNEVKTEHDLTIAGRGPRLALTRTYNSQLAAAQAGGRAPAPGPFGYGWT